MKIKVISLLVLSLSLALSGCSSDNDKNKEFGRLSIQLTDAPFPHDLVAEANVTVFKIEARSKSEGMDEENSPYILLMEEEIQVNLLDLTNGITTTLVDTEVPTGSYDLFRIFVKGINIVLADGTVYDLKVPSGEQSGIKVFVAPNLIVDGGLTADLLLDFDVSSSFVAKGNRKDAGGITGFNFKPVIKASNLSTAGTLSGNITTLNGEEVTPLEGAQVSIFAEDALITTTFSDATGMYTLMGLEAGTYTVVIELEGYVMQTAEDIPIVAANKTTKDFELIAQE
ncbi:DUF4382 domain-containing protein [Sediminicola arcticus]|jgi:hypothetical protein|uniref:DUF4382 domain-containing protein n=1 Tax=Sediminicola arcticus TaxID=1574308 RepID=A0ABV2STY1_9FLAO